MGRKSEWSATMPRFSTLIILDTPETGGMDDKQEMSFGELTKSSVLDVLSSVRHPDG